MASLVSSYFRKRKITEWIKWLTASSKHEKGLSPHCYSRKEKKIVCGDVVICVSESTGQLQNKIFPQILLNFFPLLSPHIIIFHRGCMHHKLRRSLGHTSLACIVETCTSLWTAQAVHLKWHNHWWSISVCYFLQCKIIFLKDDI